MIGAAQIATQERDPITSEIALWERAKREYGSHTTPRARGMTRIAELAALLQTFFDARYPRMSVWTDDNQTEINELLNRYNRLGRLQQGVELRKYAIHFRDADISILAPISMTREEYQNDVYLGLPIVYPLVIGSVLLAGLFFAKSALDFSLQKTAQQFKRQILDTDKQMSAAPADVRAAYQRFKEQNAKAEIETANNTEDGRGLVDKLLGKGAGWGILALLGIGIWLSTRGKHVA